MACHLAGVSAPQTLIDALIDAPGLAQSSYKRFLRLEMDPANGAFGPFDFENRALGSPFAPSVCS